MTDNTYLEHRISLVRHASKTKPRILTTRLTRIADEFTGKDQLAFRTGYRIRELGYGGKS